MINDMELTARMKSSIRQVFFLGLLVLVFSAGYGIMAMVSQLLQH
jgi:hypothetical protein